MFVLEKLSGGVTDSDGDIDVEEVMEELVQVPEPEIVLEPVPVPKVRVVEHSLVDRVDELQAMIQQLTETVHKLQISGPGMRTKKVTALSKAMVIYYHEHKAHPKLFEELEKREIPFITRIKKDEKGNAVSYKSYNWHKMKAITDESFKSLSDDEKAVYISKAEKELMPKTDEAQD